MRQDRNADAAEALRTAVDIRPDGAMDLADDCLAQLDIVIASIIAVALLLVVAVAVGASSAYKSETEATLRKGETMSLREPPNSRRGGCSSFGPAHRGWIIWPATAICRARCSNSATEPASPAPSSTLSATPTPLSGTDRHSHRRFCNTL